MKRTIGGNRLGAGKKMTAELKSYERSTHDLGYIWRSTMAAGTLVPYLTEVGLPGDTFDINLDCDVKTHPTIGPLFGSFKVQLDVFMIPMRLYIAPLHNNALKIGMNMGQIYLPQLTLKGKNLDYTKDLDNQHVNPSCLLNYLNIRGAGKNVDAAPPAFVERQFNAIPFLAYWDIYKNYYANKQEQVGAVLHGADDGAFKNVTAVTALAGAAQTSTGIFKLGGGSPVSIAFDEYTKLNITFTAGTTLPTLNSAVLITTAGTFLLGEIFEKIVQLNSNTMTVSGYKQGTWGLLNFWNEPTVMDMPVTEPQVRTFDLENIDTMRERILQHPKTTPYTINETSVEPYKLVLSGGVDRRYATLTQEGLALKTYQSDKYNNWLETEFVDGTNGISDVTAVDTTSGQFTIDQLNLANKVYNMLNRIAVSDGSYGAWIDSVYTHEGFNRVESPVYMGGLSKELAFQEITSNSQGTGDEGSQPLGTLAGKGVMGNKHKGGRVRIKVDEPCYIMGIISLTPRLDYSQGNKWDMNLKTMDDLHKPALDEIGFQDLITDQMAWWDTLVIPGNGGTPSYKSAGKQPAWINYMTNVNQVKGNFAIQSDEMFMTLNRRYEPTGTGQATQIGDLTTYIDPMKFNHIFAQTSRDAQNFWVQIGLDITARRKMSAKIIPNL